MKIGHSTIPQMRVPTFLKGQLTLFDMATLRGQWAIVCSLPPFEFGDAIFLNQCYRTVQKEGAGLLGIVPCGDPFLDTRLPKAKILRMPLLTDPLQRLRRAFGLTKRSPRNRCQSFIIDPQQVIRYHLIHQLNWRGLLFLIEILKHCQDQYPFSNINHGSRIKAHSSMSPRLQKATTFPTLVKSTRTNHEKDACYANESAP